MGRRLNQYLHSFGDHGRPTVAFVFDDEQAPADAAVVYRLNLKGRPAAQMPWAGATCADADRGKQA